MYTARKLVSDIKNDLRATGLDDRLSSRYILSKAMDKAALLFKQDADARQLFKIADCWKTIPCLELCEVEVRECGFELPHTHHMMRSRQPLPESFQSRYGNTVVVFNIDATKKFQQTTFTHYIDVMAREWVDPSVVYFILSEGHLWVPNSEAEAVRVHGLFKRPFDATRLTDPHATCLLPLDEPFPVPDYFVDIIKKQAFEELLGRARIPEDEKGNLNSNDK